MSLSMSADKKFRKEKEILLEFELNTKDLRQQLNEQLKCLDQKVETEFAILTEIQDYFKKRSEAEMEYSRSLDKIVRNTQAKHKNEKSKRDHWPQYSPYACWQNLLQRCKEESKNHSALSDLYLAVISSRISQIMEDNQRIHKKCKEIGLKCHEEIFKVLNELNTAMKTYHLYNSDFKIAEQKLKLAETQMNKIEIKDKITASKKKIITKTGRRQEKFNRNKLKVEKSRNEYILSLAAANTTIHRYYQEDLNDLIDCSSIGFLPSLSGTLQLYLQGEDRIQYSLQEGIRDMLKSINGLDAKSDKQHFLELYNSAFQLPNKIAFQHHRGDLVATFVAEPEFAEDLSVRHKQLTVRLTALRIENDEIWKTLETAEASLLAMITQATSSYNVNSLFNSPAGATNTSPAFGRNQSLYKGAGSAVVLSKDQSNDSVGPIQGSGLPSTTSSASLSTDGASQGPNGNVFVSAVQVIKHKTDRQETEEFYLKKFREYLLSGDLIARLQTKFTIIHHAVQELGPQVDLNKLSVPSQTPKKKRVIGQGGQTFTGQRPKLFGGSLEEYVLATGQDIPLIMLSTIRVINLYGLHHQGIFRVSGSQIEINEFKNAFEKGEDPLVDVKDSRDINSIAGVLKLYFRELREPLFPIYMFDQLVGLGSKIVANKSANTTGNNTTLPNPEVGPSRESIAQLRDLLATLSKPVYVAMRYLFAHLNHLSEFSDENMMDPYNLAVCFGPTLLPVPSDRDQVQYQASVNELMRVIITRQDEIFPVRRKSGGSAVGVATNAEVELGSNDYYQDEGPFYDKYLVYNEQMEEEEEEDILKASTVGAPTLTSTHSFTSLVSQGSNCPQQLLVKGGSFRVSGENGGRRHSSSTEERISTNATTMLDSDEGEEDEETSELSGTESSELEHHLPLPTSQLLARQGALLAPGTGHKADPTAAIIRHGHHSLSYKATKRDLTAVARFKFNGRNEKELSFEKGDTLKLKHKVSPEWWKGVLLSTGAQGLVPHRYLVINTEPKSSSTNSTGEENIQDGGIPKSKPPLPISTLPVLTTTQMAYKTRSISDTSFTLNDPADLDCSTLPRNLAGSKSRQGDSGPPFKSTTFGRITKQKPEESPKENGAKLSARQPSSRSLSPSSPNSALQSAFYLMQQTDSLLKPLFVTSPAVQKEPAQDTTNTLKLTKNRINTTTTTATSSPSSSPNAQAARPNAFRPTNIPDLVCGLPQPRPDHEFKFIDENNTKNDSSNNQQNASSGGGGNVVIPPPLVVNQIIRGFESRAPPLPPFPTTTHSSLGAQLATSYLKPAVRIKPAFLKKSSIHFDEDPTHDQNPFFKSTHQNVYRKRPEETDL